MTDETIETSTAAVEAWKCDGCGHLTNDMVADIKSIKDAGGLSCCPERKMQPLYMLTPHSTAVSAIAQERDVGEPVAWLRWNSYFHASPHGQDAEGTEALELCEPVDRNAFPVYLHPTTSPSAISEAPTSADAVKPTPSIEVGEMVERIEHQAISWDAEDALDAREPDEEARFYREIKALLIALDAERGRLRTALKPFAEFADVVGIPDGWSDSDKIEICFENTLLELIEVADFRRARSALGGV